MWVAEKTEGHEMESDRVSYSRRDFGRLLAAGLPLALALRARGDSKVNGVQIGAITYSFRTIANPGRSPSP